MTRVIFSAAEVGAMLNEKISSEQSPRAIRFDVFTPPDYRECTFRNRKSGFTALISAHDISIA
jgi:hypothetical protein